MKMHYLVSAFILTSVTGCANLQPPLPAVANAETGSAYIAGIFTRGGVHGMALVIRAENGSEYNLSMGEDTVFPTGQTDTTIAIKVPPGVYSVTHWFPFYSLFKERRAKQEIKNAILKRPFKLEAGSVMHLGRFNTQQDIGYRMTTYQIQPMRIMKSEVKTEFKAAYPNLAELPFSCLLCVDTIGDMVKP